MLKEYGHYHFDRLSDPKKPIYMKVYKALHAHEERVRLDLGDTGVSGDELLRIVESVCDDTPSFYYVEYTGCTLQPGAARGGVVREYTLIPKYLYSEDAIRQIDKCLSNGLKKFLSEFIRPGMSDYDKEMVIHDYLARNVSYDQRVHHETGLSPTWRDYSGDDNILGPLVRREAVCDGISDAFKVLCDYCEIPCIVVTGRGQRSRHAWNIAIIDGTPYHVDVTWDLKGGRDYLNLSDRQLLARHHTWDRDFYPPCPREWSRGQ